jgi:hypothetical protein
MMLIFQTCPFNSGNCQRNVASFTASDAEERDLVERTTRTSNVQHEKEDTHNISAIVRKKSHVAGAVRVFLQAVRYAR